MLSNLMRWGGPALIIGGLLWGLTYLTEIIIGVTRGEDVYNRADPSASVLEWFWPAFFMGAVLFLGIGLLGVWARLEGRSRMLGFAGALLACTAIAAASINLVLLTGVTGEPTAADGLGFVGVMGVLIGATFLGIASIRAKVLPRWSRFVLTFLFFAFVPAIIVTIPLEGVVPDYVIADLPFPVVGAVLALVGYAMLEGRASEIRRPAPMTT
jgi:hypothetical protein